MLILKIIRQYYKILTTVIKEAKRHMSNSRISNSNNKMKTTWNIIKMEKNRLKGATNTTPIVKSFPRPSTDISCQYPKILLMVLEAKLTKFPTLLRTRTITCQTYFINPFLALSFKIHQPEKVIKSLIL